MYSQLTKFGTYWSKLTNCAVGQFRIVRIVMYLQSI